MSTTERDTVQAAREIIAVGRDLHETGLVAGTAGNLSVRLRSGRILITRSGSNLGRLDEASLVEVPTGPAPGGSSGASSELLLHRAAYRADEAVGGVVHTHAPALVAAGLRDIDVGEVLPEVTLGTGPIARLPLLASGSEALGLAVGKAVARGAGVILLRRHGAVAVGPTARVAADRMELAELAAYSVLLGSDPGDVADPKRIEALAARLGSLARASS